MQVKKRSGKLEPVSFDKVLRRLTILANLPGRALTKIDLAGLAQTVIAGIYDGVTTVELDNLAAETSATKAVIHPEYAQLAANISVSNLHKNTPESFSEAMRLLYENRHPKTGAHAPQVREDFYKLVLAYAGYLDVLIKHENDYTFDYFGYKTLERAYLMTSNGCIVERPQYMFLRVALEIHQNDLAKVKETYLLLSKKAFTHATPTLYNSGTPRPQLSSCFLLTMMSDSVDGIYDTLSQCAKISQSAGGIGLAVHDIRATGSHINGTNGKSNGLVPMLKVYNETARHIDQGGRRKGAFAAYLEPWHADIFEFIELRKNHGKDEMRARDLFLALWVPDLFMQRVAENGNWSLFCPNEAPGLPDCYGVEFERLYTRYEAEGRARKTILAVDLMRAITDAQIETGTPYMVYKDIANRKSNHKNLGVIKSSNLCSEIIEYSAPDETAVCNLASLSLPYFIAKDKAGNNYYDFKELHRVAKVVTVNLDKVIDRNYYPTPQTEKSNKRHRPIGIGVQGLANVFAILGIPFDSDEAKLLDAKIFETIYHGSVEASTERAKELGPYYTYDGSPASKGILQFDLWDSEPNENKGWFSGMYDWDKTKAEIAKDGMRNSLLLAPMPTASTSQILGNNECFEAFTSNLYLRRTLAGEFAVVNHHLVADLDALGLWDDRMRQRITAAQGSIQPILEIPARLKAIYKTVWEISQKKVLEMSASRGRFICQSQSLNIHIKDATQNKIASMHMVGWKLGLKTGMYYLRSQAATQAIQFTVDRDVVAGPQVCSIDTPDCEACGS